MDAVDVVEAIAKRRSYRLKGGSPDIEKASLALLVDYRTGALGRISLETPETRQHMMEAFKQAKAEKTKVPEYPSEAPPPDTDYLD
jgi:ribosome biogenesis GTPase A